MTPTRGSRVRYTDDDLLVAVKRAADALGDPLSVYAYQQAAADLGLPSHMTIIKRFESWSHACELAGIKSNLAHRIYGGYTQADCIVALRKCAAEIGHHPTYARYAEWAKAERDYPSGPTVRLKCGKWSSALEEAFVVVNQNPDQ